MISSLDADLNDVFKVPSPKVVFIGSRWTYLLKGPLFDPLKGMGGQELE